jgi:carboxyl-terminal processing protease
MFARVSRLFPTCTTSWSRTTPNRSDADKAIYNGAIPGMLRMCSTRTRISSIPRAIRLLREEQRGKYYGVGMQVGPRNNKIIVIAPFAGAPGVPRRHPSRRHHCQRRWQATDNMTTSDVADLLKGPKGTTVHVTVLREGTEKPLEFSVMRDEIPRYSVDLALPDPPRHRLHARQRVPGNHRAGSHQALDQMGDIKGLSSTCARIPAGCSARASAWPTSSSRRDRSSSATTGATVRSGFTARPTATAARTTRSWCW